MNICEAIKAGREQDKAIRQKCFAVATLLVDDWELAEAPYHGHMAANAA